MVPLAIVGVAGLMGLFYAAGCKSQFARRIWCVFHHLLTALLAAASLSRHSLTLFTVALLLEIGFEISDSLWALFGLGWTGLRGFPLFLHHGLSAALGLYFFLLVEQDVVAFQVVAPFIVIFVGGGASDLFWAKVVPSLGVARYSTTQYAITAVYSLLFFYLRGWMFVSNISIFFAHNVKMSTQLGVVSYVAVAAFGLYHLLLTIGVLASFKFGGRLPERKNQ